MPMIARYLAAAVCIVSLCRVVSLAAQNPASPPPVKPGLWETTMSQLDANGHEVPSPELAALAKMPPEMRDKMADAMRARGIQMPDENGAMKACLSKETLDSGTWQQLASDSGCTTTFSTRSSSTWSSKARQRALNALAMTVRSSIIVPHMTTDHGHRTTRRWQNCDGSTASEPRSAGIPSRTMTSRTPLPCRS